MLPSKNTNIPWTQILLAVFCLACLAWWWESGRLGQFTIWIWEVYSDRDSLRATIENAGVQGAGIFIALQALQVVIAPIPGEITGSVGGFIYGGLEGSIYATVGLIIGSAIAFALGRLLGRPFVYWLVPSQYLQRFSFLLSSRGKSLVFLLFVIPGFPKDILTYVCSLSPMPMGWFLLYSNLGRLPGTVLLAFSGDALFSHNWIVLGAIVIFSCLVAGLGYIYRERILMFWSLRTGFGKARPRAKL